MNVDGNEPGLEGVLDRITDGVFVLDTGYRIVYANEAGREILCEAIGEELSMGELQGRDLWTAIPEVVDTPFYDHYTGAMESQEPVSFDEYYEPIGRWFDVRAYPSETGLTVYFRDVTEERQRRTELEMRDEVLREMYATVADQTMSFEEQVDELLRIGQDALDMAFGTLSWISGDDYVFEVVRAPDDSVEAGDVVDLETTNCERVVLTQESLVLANVEEEAPGLAGKAGNVEWGIECYLGTLVVVDGEPYGTFCFYDTEPRAESFSEWEVTLVDLMGEWVGTAIERELTREHLVRQNEQLDRFASMVSHDLKAPLSVASGWTAEAKRECDSEALENVEAALDRMDTLVSDILSLARAGKRVETVEQCDVAEAGTAAWGAVPTADATLEVPDEFAVPADRSRLQQLLENLFRNAVEHGGADVTVRVGELPKGFYVEDTGPGIPEDEREEALEFGYSTGAGGTGQGLSIVEQIADAHGWSLEITDGRDGGARFEFTDVW